LLEKNGFPSGVQVDIKKRIPVGAGLGGGSSNAATTLKALNQLLKLNLNKRELMEIGAGIGADVPFFLFEGSAVGSGIGDRLRKITLPRLWYILIYPNFEVSARWAYQNIILTHLATHPRPELGPMTSSTFEGEMKNRRSGSTLNKSWYLYGGVEGLTKLKYDINLRKLLKSREAIARLLHNDLEKVVSARYPEIALIKEMLAEAGATGSMMTGSGPTVFGLFPGEEKVKVAFQNLKKRVKRRGWKVIKAHSIQ
jgi:4-diphosphocytidyl-2-C-methyl-D-erythritol kinase